MTDEDRPTFLVSLQPKPGVDPVRALRRLLKYASRALGLRCTHAEVSTQTAEAFRQLRDDVARRAARNRRQSRGTSHE
jgi:hypothetical protein